MENNKSPGFDGLTTNFYKHFWPLFGSRLTYVFNYALKAGSLSVTQRRGIITLIFKKGDRTRLKNWRPITLLTTDYKILTKALANRLKKVLPTLIHSDQTACVPGRTINDNVSLIRDAIYYANETNTLLALISIDQLKAFDRVSHDFLFQVLHKFGFGQVFQQWIKTIYHNVSSSVKVNGWFTAFINLERGLRQGCALSMPLYILTPEILATHIRMNPNIRGLKTPDQQHEVKLSQYADDTSLLLRDDASTNTTFKCLNDYQRASRAKINCDKCKGLWSGSMKHRTDHPLDLDWYNDLLPDPILGTFFGNTDCTQRNLQPRLQKVKNTIAAWNHRELSYKGKALVINGLLTSTLWYTATSSAIPSGIISEIEQAIYGFFWDNKTPLTNRDILALPTSEGGFNVHKIHWKIEALCLNTLRRLLDPTPAHWKLFTQYFLRISNTQLGKLALATTYSLAHINNDIPTFHQELLRAWSAHRPHHTRINIPDALPDILNEPLFCNDLLSLDGTPLYNKDWINAGLTQIKDICYLAIPGLLPVQALHEIISQHVTTPTRSLNRTAREFRDIVRALPPSWIRLIYLPPPTSETTPQPSFTISNPAPNKPPQPLAQGKIRTFYLHIAKLHTPTIPALQHWRDNLHPAPTFNHSRWKQAYPPLANNKQGDNNWKILHRILPTAQRLHRMTVYHSPNCHHCGSTEDIAHLLLHCPTIQTFWLCIQDIITKLTDHQISLADSHKLFGYLRQKDDNLPQATTNLVNWTLTLARNALQNSAAQFRLHGTTVTPKSIFKVTVISNIKLQFRICKLRHTTYYFPYTWGIKDALVTISNDKLTFNI